MALEGEGMPLIIRSHIQYGPKVERKPPATLVVHRPPSRWTDERIDLLKKLYGTTPNDKLAILFKTTVNAVKAKARSYGIYKLGRDET